MNDLQALPTISTTELQKHIKDTFKRVTYGEHILIESSGFPVGVLMPPSEYKILMKMRKNSAVTF